ncbi:MAG TPA: hypothetical protein VKQ70_03995 [Caulobacteraceae bacterium]|jgi:hypothetical protein|nr:hypothetical protein [Caulobacteraceae bacterium]
MNQAVDFGGSPGKGLNRLVPRLFVIGAIATFAAGTAWDLVWQHQQIAKSTADTNVAAIVGPPCPASRAVYNQAMKLQGPLPYVFSYNGVTFGRYFGYADCSVAEAKGSAGLGSYVVCQFTSPSVLYVRTARGAFFFTPGVGQKASVMTENGVARCVMAAPAEANLTG